MGTGLLDYTLMDLSDHEKALYNLLCLCYIINSGILYGEKSTGVLWRCMPYCLLQRARQHECYCFLKNMCV